MKKLYKSVLILVCTFLLILSSGCTFINNAGLPPYNYDADGLPNSLASAQAVTVSESSTEGRVKLDLVDAVDKVERSVVVIATSSNLGSGVIVDIETSTRKENEYYILTCHHVIASGGDIMVYLPDENSRNFNDDGYNTAYAFSGKIGRQIYNTAVTLVGGDEDSDVAVLKLNVNNKNIDKKYIVEAKVPPLNYNLRKGEEVFAIGNPTGYLPGTLSVGYVSYINRTATIGEVGNMTLNQLNLDTYAGSSGGGLFNYYGELVGITNAGNVKDIGINYAIALSNSADQSKDTGFKIIAKQLVATATATNYGYVSGRWHIGIDISEREDIFGNVSVYVSSIEQGGNEYLSGIRNKDIIKSITYGSEGNEKTVKITSETAFMFTVYDLKSTLKLGDSFKMSILRQVDNSGATQNYIYEISLAKQFIFCDTSLT